MVEFMTSHPPDWSRQPEEPLPLYCNAFDIRGTQAIIRVCYGQAHSGTAYRPHTQMVMLPSDAANLARGLLEAAEACGYKPEPEPEATTAPPEPTQSTPEILHKFMTDLRWILKHPIVDIHGNRPGPGQWETIIHSIVTEAIKEANTNVPNTARN